MKDKKIGKNLITAFGFTILMGILLWRCSYSVNYGDEPYCISSVWRFFKGDALLAEDWFPAQQLIAWILSPLISLYHLIFHSNEGIVLASRYAYVIFQGVIAIAVFLRTKRYGDIRIAAVFMYLLFTQNNMMTLNYNTIGIGLMMLLLAILMTEEKYSPGMLFFCGVLAAIIVLSQPYAILLFLLWSLLNLCVTLFVGKKRELHPLLRFQTIFYVGLGAFSVLVIFVIVVLSRAKISEVVNGFHYLTNDPEHQMDLHYKVSKYFERFYRYYKFPILAVGLSLVVGMFKNNRFGNLMRMECFLISAISTVYSLIYHGWISDYVPIDFICVPVLFFGISVWLLGDKRNKEILCIWIIPSLLYTFCVQLTTNTGILAVSSACIVGTAGAVLMIWQTLNHEGANINKIVYHVGVAIFAVVLMLQGSLLLYHRINDVWWSDPINTCSVKLEKGPAAGIYTSPEDAKEYYDSLEQVDQLELTKEDRVLFLELEPMLYLYADLPIATYSTWTIEENNFLKNYYELYPEKMPTVVYWKEATDKEEAVSIQYFLDNGYGQIPVEQGIALRKMN